MAGKMTDLGYVSESDPYVSHGQYGRYYTADPGSWWLGFFRALDPEKPLTALIRWAESIEDRAPGDEDDL